MDGRTDIVENAGQLRRNELSDPTNASPLELVRLAAPRLAGGKLRAAEVILRDPRAVGENSITWLANEASTSATTITRLASSLGFAGFPALRAAIALENGRGAQAGWEREIGAAILPDDPPEQVLSTLAGNQFNAARSAMASVDLAALTTLAGVIVGARRVHLFAEWGDAPVAYELFLRMFRIGIPIWFHEGAHIARIAAGLQHRDDLALVISRSGESAIAEHFFEVARVHAVTTAVITGDPNSRLASFADISVATGTPTVGVTSWTDYFAGRSSDTLVCAALWALVAQRVPDLMGERLEAEDITAEPGVPRRRRAQK